MALIKRILAYPILLVIDCLLTLIGYAPWRYNRSVTRSAIHGGEWWR